MKNNEIGHFPCQPPKNQFEEGSYPRTILKWEGENIIWPPNWKTLGKAELVNLPVGHPFGKILVDLQTGDACCCADEIEYKGVKYVYLQGSGWADEGFPFHDKTFDPNNPYETGKGCYALIKGQARNKFVKLAKQDCIPSFNDCSTGDIKKDFALPKN